ncbi:MAG TPA: helix-turn-helix domain-containing protein [Gaiellaceae bacterium]
MRCRSCPPLPEQVRRVTDLLERRWTISILYVSHEGAVRFNEFLQALGTIPPATLAQRLADLEKAGVLERAVIDSRPPLVEYRLTERGRQLRSLLRALTRYAETA